MEDARDRMCLDSDNMTYTAVDAVFQVFRRRLTPQQGLDFASVLPSVLRAIFVYRWDVSQPPVEFDDRDAMTTEAKAVRSDHNLTPENAIEATAWAVRRCVDQKDFDRVLAEMPEGAADFWRVEVDNPTDLHRRII
jgi:uncharacterized protein (DUF2267 family)